MWDVRTRHLSCGLATDVVRSYQKTLQSIWSAGVTPAFTPRVKSDGRWWSCTVVAPFVNDHYNIACSPGSEYADLTDHDIAALFRFRPHLAE